jgi:hypothetical protein
VDEEQLKTGWEPFLHWAAFFWDTPRFDFDLNERDYKLSAVVPFHEARAALSGGDWLTPLGRGFKNKDANLVTHYQFTPFLDWVAEDLEAGRVAVGALWQPGDATGPERMETFDAVVPTHVLPGPGIRCNLAAYVLSAADPYAWPNYKVTATELACELTQHPLPERDCSLGARYGHALDLYDELIDRAAAHGMRLRDRLDAQGLLWCIAGGVAGKRPASFSSEEWDEFLAFRTIPSALRQARRATPKSTRPAKAKLPPRALCPLCGNDEEVRLLGRAADGDRWEFVCESGPNHPRLEPFSFSAG